MGLYGYPGPNVPDDSQYAIVARRNKPASAPSDFPIACEAMLRARGLIYYKNNPGDCGAPPPVAGFGSGQIVGLSGTAASGVIGGLGAAGAISGAATLGIGTAITLAVAGIEGIFAHHAQAVANEQSTICAVAGYFNPLIKQIDNAVRSGAITASEGVVFMQQIAQQAINGLSSIMKVCNAACVYVGVLKAHIDFVSYFYPKISPPISIGANNPGGAPDYFGTPPGGVTVSSNTVTNGPPTPPLRSQPGNQYLPAGPSAYTGTGAPLTSNMLLPGSVLAPDYLNRGYNQQTGQSAQRADVASTTNWGMWAALAAIVAAFVAVLGVMGRSRVAA